MNISFRYNKSDYLSLLHLKDFDNNLLKRSRLIYKVAIPLFILLIILFIWPQISPYYVPTIAIGGILITLWIIFSNSLYNHNRDKIYKRMVESEFSKNIDTLKDTTLTLSEDYLTREIEGMYSRISWSFLDKIYVTDTNIFIYLISGAIINVPIRAFNTKDEIDIFLKYIDSHINKNSGLKINNTYSPTLYKSINKLGEFLAVRDIEDLSVTSLYNKYNIDKVDVLILLGNAIPYTISVAYEAYKKGICSRILISGGIGHSTELLRYAIKKDTNLNNIDIENRAEADIFKDILVKHYNVPEEIIILENKSTNCGDNAVKSVELLDELSISYNSIMLIQDPTMQLRSYACFTKYLEGRDIKIINYAPFIPTLSNNMNFINIDINGIWDINRYLNLISGEIPRLTDDENGYGPNGKNFISHIDIPEYITSNYKEITNLINNRR